jgi:hypothetical protein
LGESLGSIGANRAEILGAAFSGVIALKSARFLTNGKSEYIWCRPEYAGGKIGFGLDVQHCFPWSALSLLLPHRNLTIWGGGLSGRWLVKGTWNFLGAHLSSADTLYLAVSSDLFFYSLPWVLL